MANDELLAELLKAENSVWQALMDADWAADAALLAPEFLGVYPSGMADREDHIGQLEDGPTIAAFTLSQARAMALAPDLGLLSYHAEFRRPGSKMAEKMYVSSLWRHDGQAWRNLFSQDTPIP